MESETDTVPDRPDLSTQGPSTELPPPPALAPDDINPPGEPRRRRRRGPNKKKAPEIEAQPVVAEADLKSLAAALGAGFGVAGDVLASARGPHWRVSEQERETLGTVWAVALAPYMGVAGKWMPLILATVTTVGVFVPKYTADTKLANAAPADDVRRVIEDGGYKAVDIEPGIAIVTRAEVEAARTSPNMPPDVPPHVNKDTEIKPPPRRRAPTAPGPVAVP